jgi:hypothetical protein
LSLFQLCVDRDPDQFVLTILLLSCSVWHYLARDSVSNPGAFEEEGLNKFHNQLLIEKLIENFLRFGALQRDRHEGEFKHCVFGFVLALAGLDFVQGGIKNSCFFAVISAQGDVSCAKSDQGTHIQGDR